MQLGPAHLQALALTEQGRYAEAEAGLRKLLAEQPQDQPALRAVGRLRMLQGHVETPADPAAAVALAQSLAALQGPPATQGADEGVRLDRAAELVLGAMDRIPETSKPVAAKVLWQAAYYDQARALGGPLQLAALALEAGAPNLLLHQLAKVETDADRLGMMQAHRTWGEGLEAAAAQRPIARPPRVPRERLRLGFLSSDLRFHVVAFFVQPLFEFIDARFELYIYSGFQGPADGTQTWFASRAAAVRQLPPDDHDAAQMIAADDLDMLLDLAGPTAHGRPGVLAFRPAGLQTSWLGYAHSLGLAAIDHLLVDPFLAPARPELLLEAPLQMPTSWICMAPAAFHPQPAVAVEPPVERTGYISFGTANDPYKFSSRLLDVWAQVLAGVAGSRLIIARPEAGAASFRENIGRIFERAGVSPDRLDFRAIRGAVRRVYDDIDIALDTFPVTGGTTTCEALWMGAPTVSRVGPALYERLSWSILNNVGLPELCANRDEDYVAIAVALAKDPPRITQLRNTLRARIRLQPIGQPARFAADFYETIAQAIARAQA